MSFSEIRDQAAPVRLLRNMLRRERTPHGLLFWGPPGVGKRLTALCMASAVNCAEGDGDPCGACDACARIRNGKHPDVMQVRPVKRARVINVEAIETITDLAALHPRIGRRRVFLIEEAERMNETAQNKFLKTLEEPPGRSMFILLSAHPDQLLPTVRSRCQQVRFGALRPETVLELLTREMGDALTPGAAAAVASLAQGQMKRAASLANTERRDYVLELASRLGGGEDPLALSEDFAARLKSERERIQSALKAEHPLPDRKDVKPEERESAEEELDALVAEQVQRDMMEYLYLLETWYRDVLVYHRLGAASVWNRDQEARLKAAPDAGVFEKIAAIDTARRYLERFLKEDRVFRDLFFVLAA